MDPNLNSNNRAYRFFLVRQGIEAFLFTLAFTVQAVYFILNARLDPFQLVLVGTVLEVSCFLFEVPTGIVADTYSRRLSVLIGFSLWGVGFLIEGAFPFFWVIVVSQVIMALGYTFNSGALEAWIAGEVGEENLGPAFLRASQVGRICALGAIVAAMGLGSLNPAIPILVAGVGFVCLAIYGVIAMPETGFTRRPKEEREGWRDMVTTFKDGSKVIRTSPVLVIFMLLTLFAGASTEGMDRLWEAHFLQNFAFPGGGYLQPVVWFGLMNVGLLLLGMLSTFIIQKRVDTNNHNVVARVLIAFCVLQIAFLVWFALAGEFVMAVLAFWGMSLFRGIAGPLFRAWLAQSIEPRVRATVLSMVGQSDAIGQMTVGPVIGWIGTVRSIRAALVFSAVLLAPVVPLVAMARNRTVATPPEQDVVLEGPVAAVD
ncbi:MAG: MFS transporter [Chloroflexota bacterium]|nr:MFS transporter [Chloroflexota bacterium]